MSIRLPMFGLFSIDELKKFIRMGTVFGLIIGVYWSLGALKQATICVILGPSCVPYARIFSMIGMIPLLMLYSKLLDRYTRQKVFFYLSLSYACGAMLFAVLFAYEQLYPVIAYLFAFMCDSYGSLLVALFWAIAIDTTFPDPAKRGFPLIVALGQVGGVLLPISITYLPRQFGYTTVAPLLILSVIPIMLASFVLRYFFRVTPPELQRSFHGGHEPVLKTLVKPGFFEGLRTIYTHTYVAAIAVLCLLPDMLSIIFDMHFLMRAHESRAHELYFGVALAEYLGWYSAAINGCTLVLLLCGMSNVSRYVGMAGALMVLPCMFAIALCGFSLFDNLAVLFLIMVCTKSLNYAFNVPLIKQLYIPTSHDVRFKAQAWIDGFGLHSSKVIGSFFNMLLYPLQEHAGLVLGRMYHVMLSTTVGCCLLLVWIPVAYWLGIRYQRTIGKGDVVC